MKIHRGAECLGLPLHLLQTPFEQARTNCSEKKSSAEISNYSLLTFSEVSFPTIKHRTPCSLTCKCWVDKLADKAEALRCVENCIARPKG